jgi:hypothetical protein
MKKLVSIIVLSAVVTTILLVSCNKQPNLKITPNSIEIGPSETQEKSNSCGCSVSGFWNSCSITCPLVNGVCAANCTTVSILWGFMASAASCTCGGARVGKYRVPSGVSYDDINISNLNGLDSFISGNNLFVSLDKELDELLTCINTNTGDLIKESQDFFTELESLSQTDALKLKPTVDALKIKNGRN